MSRLMCRFLNAGVTKPPRADAAGVEGGAPREGCGVGRRTRREGRDWCPRHHGGSPIKQIRANAEATASRKTSVR